MDGLTPGRMVHYVSYGTPNGEFGSKHRAAVISEVQQYVLGAPVIVDLVVLNPNGLFFNLGVVYDPDGAPGTWHWIEGSPGSADNVKKTAERLDAIESRLP